MVAVSGGLLWLGYWVLSYGWSQVQGSNAGFFDLAWPGRYTGNTPDGPAKAATSTYGSGVTSLLGSQVAAGQITQQEANEDVSGNATVGLGTATFSPKNTPAQAAAKAKRLAAAAASKKKAKT